MRGHAIRGARSDLADASGSTAEIARKAGLKVVEEFYEYRAYHPSRALVSRGKSGSILHDATPMWSHTIPSRTSCDCTTASTAQKNYRPGSKGTVTAIFAVGQRTGVHDKIITVSTNDPKEPQTILKLHVLVSELLRITPTTLSWQVGDTAVPKALAIKVVSNSPVHVVRVVSDNPHMVSKLKTVEPGKEYTVLVTPQDTTTTIKTTLRIETDFPSKNPRALIVPLQIRAVRRI